MTAANLDLDRITAFTQRAFADIGGLLSTALAALGDRLGFYRTLAERGGLTSHQLAEATGTHERNVREWLAHQAAAGYLEYDPSSERFTLPAEHAVALTDETSPHCMLGGFQSFVATLQSFSKLEQAFRSGCGLGWHEHDAGLFEGTERFFRPGYETNLVDAWIPALDGVKQKLESGGLVADVGCGHGASTLIMARAFPASRFVGFDYHEGSIERANRLAAEAGLADRVRFEVAAADAFPGSDYDLVCCFDCLHDMGDPVAAASHVRKALAVDGAWMVVEPFANDRLEENLTPVGVVFYGASTMVCTPASLAQDGQMALGAQAGEARLADVIRRGGFGRVRRATETPFNLVLEARA